MMSVLPFLPVVGIKVLNLCKAQVPGNKKKEWDEIIQSWKRYVIAKY